MRYAAHWKNHHTGRCGLAQFSCKPHPKMLMDVVHWEPLETASVLTWNHGVPYG